MWMTPIPDADGATQRHPNSARFHELLSELGDLHDRKQKDYGRGDDPFANVRSSTDWGVPGWVGAMVRANDKVRRLQSLILNGKLENESAEDSLRDLAVYTIIALVLFEQEHELVTNGKGCTPDVVERVGEYTPEAPDFDAERQGWA